jgi:hypothetical protein
MDLLNPLYFDLLMQKLNICKYSSLEYTLKIFFVIYNVEVTEIFKYFCWKDHFIFIFAIFYFSARSSLHFYFLYKFFQIDFVAHDEIPYSTGNSNDIYAPLKAVSIDWHGRLERCYDFALGLTKQLTYDKMDT